MSVRGFRLLVALTLVNTVLLGSMVLGPQLFPFARQQLQAWKDARAQKSRLAAELAVQQSCRTHSEPPTKVRYEEDPLEAVKLLAASPASYDAVTRQVGGPWQAGGLPGWVAPVKAKNPDYYDWYLGQSVSSTRYDPLLFLHERTAPAGDRFVVSVRLQSLTVFSKRVEYDEAQQADAITFRQRKERYLQADWWPIGAGGSVDGRGKGRMLGLRLSLPDHADRVVARMKPDAPIDAPPVIDYGNRLRFYAGQPDAADASNFTIDYELDGRPGTIDGWLRNDGLQLRPREGSLTYDPNQGEVWKLPTTAPSADR